MRELGVFCGTFNPIHWGHLVMAEMAADQFALEKVFIITSPQPPHRHEELLDAQARHQLVLAAVSGNPRLVASRIELDREGPSYTFATLRQILEDEAGSPVRLNLIIGEDNLPFIGQWRNADEILRTCRLLVAPRQKQDRHEFVGAGATVDLPDFAQIAWLQFPRIDVSSTMIRERLAQSRSVLYLVPREVNAILLEKGLYK